MAYRTHKFEQKVFYCDTDSYGVVWHGNYLRWLEMGRVYLCEMAGKKLSELEKRDIVLPVSELSIKYKQPAKLDDEIIIETKIIEKTKVYFVFHQTIMNKNTNKVLIEAKVKVVAIHQNGNLYRTMPDEVLKICEDE